MGTVVSALLEAADAGHVAQLVAFRANVGEIGFDTVLSHIAIDPMPPHERARGRRWCGESGIEPIGGVRLVRETSPEERNDQGGACGLHPSENVVRAMVMERRRPLNEGIDERGLR